MRIAIDMDEVIADFVPKFLALTKKNLGLNLTVADLQGAMIRDKLPQHAEGMLEIIRDPGFFRDLPPVQDSVEVVGELARMHEIFITTAAMEFPTSFTAKYEWLKENFGFISPMNYVFCGDKSIIWADYLIDDNSRHFERFQGTGLLFSAPHNLHVQGFPRVSSWREVRAYFATKTE